MKSIFASLLLCLTGLAAADDRQVAVIQIRSQPAAALVDSVRPLLGQGGSVSAYHDRLIVNGNPDEIAAVRSLLSEIDRPPRRLIIEVRQAGSLSQSTQNLGYGVRSDAVRLGHVPPGRDAQLFYQDLQTRTRDDSLQRVQALDGRPAQIRTGQSVPIYEAHQQVFGNRIVQGYQVQYRDLNSGFVAVPRVHGDQVTVEIYQQHERAAASGRFESQQAATVLRGGIGQWLTLGSVGDDDTDSRNQPGWHAQTRRSQDRQLELRVLPVD